MIAALVLSLVLAAPSQSKVYRKDVETALKELEKECGHFFKTKGIEWGKVRREMLKAVRKIRNDQEQFMLLNRLLARLRDGHAYVKTEAAKWPDRGEWRGPGMFLCTDGKRVLVKECWGGAAKAGIKPGMEVLSIDRQPALKWLESRETAIADLSSFSTDQQRRFFTCHWGLAGPSGERMKLELRRVDGKTKKVTLARTSKRFIPELPAFAPGDLKRIGRISYGRTRGGYAYIHLRNIPSDLPDVLDKILAEIGDAPGLILDSRACGGGGTDHDAVFGRFVPPGKTLSFGKRYASAGEHPFIGPMVVIVDAGCRSAGETISGMFKEDGRAYLIGPGPTAGMSSSKRTIPLPSGKFALYVSVRSNKARFNGGKGIEGIGVPPHEVVACDPADLAAGIDTQIERAEELLSKNPSNRAVPYKPERFGWKPPS